MSNRKCAKLLSFSTINSTLSFVEMLAESSANAVSGDGSCGGMGGGGELQSYMEVYQRDIGIGTMVWACYCPQYDVNKGSDGCEFDGRQVPER